MRSHSTLTPAPAMYRYFVAIAVLGVIAATASPSWAVPAAPVVYNVRQPNGVAFQMRQRGDERFHWHETVAGNPIVRDEKTKYWTYAVPSAQGPRAGTGRVGDPKAAPRTPWKPTAPATAVALRKSQETSSIAPRVVPPTGVGLIPTILVTFPDTTTTFGPSDFQNLIEGTGNKSMKELYTEMSGGTFTVSTGPGGVVGWYVASHPHDYYGTNSGGFDAHPGELVREAVIAADGAGFDFSPYDLDHDGIVDVVNIIHQGHGEEAFGTATDIWSHRWTLSSAGAGSYTTNDGVVVNDYMVEPELLLGSSQMTVGVFCHEYGHALGIPDLYDTDGSSEGIGEWSLMASGSWNGSLGNSPAHMDAWCKMELGWLTPTVPTTNLTGAAIPQAATNQFAYKLWTNGSQGSQYYLVENRQKVGFDSGLKGAGLVIYHVDETMYNTSSNNVNTREWYPGHTSTGHYFLRVVQADNLYHLEKKTNRADANDTWKSQSFNAGTAPNSRSYAGADTLVGVNNISVIGATMTADIAVAPSAGGALSIGITNPVNNTVYTSVSQATGTAGGTGLSQVQVGLARYDASGEERTGWWNWTTSTFSTDPATMLTKAATGTSSWSASLPSMPFGKYDVVARSTDGTTFSGTSTVTFTVTATAAYTIGITSPADSSSASAVAEANGTATGAALDSMWVGVAHYDAAGTTRLGWWDSEVEDWNSDPNDVWVYPADGLHFWTFDIRAYIPTTSMPPGRYDIRVYTYNGTSYNTSRTNTFYIVPAGVPTITPTSTAEDSMTGATVYVTANAADGANVTHFKISGISGGTLYLSNGTTVVANNSFIATAQGLGLKFKPAANANTPAGDSIGFSAQAAVDNSGTSLSAGAPVSITVGEINDEPVAGDDSAGNINEADGDHIFASALLLSNDSRGPANESGQTLLITQVSNVVGGTAVVTAGDVVFSPTYAFNGAAGFDYTVQDNGTTAGIADAKTDTAHVTFTVTGSTLPEATPQAITAAQGSNKVIVLAGTDPNGDPLRFKVVSLPAEGSLYNGNGVAGHKILAGELPYLLTSNLVTYRPTAPSFTGPDNFTFRVNDGTNDSADAATVSVTVMVDTTPPVVAITNPPDGTASSNRTSFYLPSGTVVDDGTVASVKLTLYSYGLAKYWNGTAWVASFSLTANYNAAAGTWSYTGGVPNNLSGATNLPEGKYRLIATAKDSLNNISTATSIITINLVAPTVTITAPATNSVVTGATTFPAISGLATDANGPLPSGLNRVSLLLFCYPRNAYWNGTAWQTAAFRLPATLNMGTGEWSYTSPLPDSAGGNLNEGKYKITATSYDNAGNNKSADTLLSVNMTPPTVAIAAPVNEATLNGISAFPAVDGMAGDAGGIQPSGINRVSLAIYSYQRNQYWTGSAWGSQTLFPTTLNTSTGAWSHTGSGLPGGGNLKEGKYRILAWAYDGVNNPAVATSIFYVNMVLPTVAITAPVHNSTVTVANSFPTITGTSSDSAGAFPSGLNKVTLLLYSYPRNAYWNGAAWQAGAIRLNATLNTGTGAWSYSGPMPDNLGANTNLDAGKYKVTATSYDIAGNTVSANNVVTIQLGGTPSPTGGSPAPTGGSPAPTGGTPGNGQGGLSSSSADSAAQTVTLVFAKVLDPASATAAYNYLVTVNGVTAAIDSAGYSRGAVTLVLRNGVLRPGDSIVVTWSGVTDIYGEALTGQTAPMTAR